ncbi:uncharacterized protein LOC113123404 isoform X2 [Mastacembelus armatus]|uniref:uncharacterized protein LOC113123404 isoform X2 n=1 Tax=Mastacembelus armatus TaxID=205130 RepID=UPI000E4655AA|nr:uncharacterized protein LOC113123404 isoform X2 [Mastacembelus armatus]
MVIMFSVDKAALLSIQLFVVCHAHAALGDLQVDHRNILVSRGDSISLTCNISMKNATQINWTKDKKNIFTYSKKHNQTFSNFTSHRLRIETDSPTQLNISNAQHDDSGLYTCNVNARNGPQDIVWNLTVSQSLDEMILSWPFLYILAPVTGFLLCSLMVAVCICRKHGTMTPNQNPVQGQFDLQSGGEGVVSQEQADMDHRPNNRRSQYLEKLNPIYGHS